MNECNLFKGKCNLISELLKGKRDNMELLYFVRYTSTQLQFCNLKSLMAYDAVLFSDILYSNSWIFG